MPKSGLQSPFYCQKKETFFWQWKDIVLTQRLLISDDCEYVHSKSRIPFRRYFQIFLKVNILTISALLIFRFGKSVDFRAEKSRKSILGGQKMVSIENRFFWPQFLSLWWDFRCQIFSYLTGSLLLMCHKNFAKFANSHTVFGAFLSTFEDKIMFSV